MNVSAALAAPHAPSRISEGAKLVARLERLPATRPVMLARGCVGMATFFDGYTTIAIAYAMPELSRIWHLTPTSTAALLSAGYLGQLIGAILCGWAAERWGRMPVLMYCIGLFAVMSGACIFAWSPASLMIFRFAQGIGTGGEVPVASAYVNELSGSRKRGRFFLLYELLFLVGLTGAGAIASALVPAYGWEAMFVVGMVPILLTLPLRFFLSESPRWLISKGRIEEAEKAIGRFEASAIAAGHTLPEPVVTAAVPQKPVTGSVWKELFSPLYGPRTGLLWIMWFGAYLINNGLLTWLPTLYKTVFHLPVATAIHYSFTMTGFALMAALACALLIDRTGRRRWYIGALVLAPIPLIALYVLGAPNAKTVLWLATPAFAAIQTVTYSLYLYSGELYPTRLRSLGAGLGSAWLRLGSMAGPWVIGLAIAKGSVTPVFLIFAGISLVTAFAVMRWAPETRGQSLETLSP
jgi:MFS transporter, putative metabolite:H+ symporter